MPDFLKFASSYAILFGSDFLDTECDQWYEKTFSEKKSVAMFKDLQNMLDRIPEGATLYRLARKEIIERATNPAELVDVVILTQRSSEDERRIVARILEYAKDDDGQTKRLVNAKISLLDGDMKGRMRRLFHTLLK